MPVDIASLAGQIEWSSIIEKWARPKAPTISA